MPDPDSVPTPPVAPTPPPPSSSPRSEPARKRTAIAAIKVYAKLRPGQPWRWLSGLWVVLGLLGLAVILQDDMVFSADAILELITAGLSALFFFKIGGEQGIPFIVLWLLTGGIFFTLRFKFINLRGCKHAIAIVRGKYDDPSDVGEVSHFQALATSVSGTVGLGNIAGVAVAIQLGGPGAMFWLTLAGFLGMSLKFIECTLGVKYRQIQPDGTILGGPMYYLTQGLAARQVPRLGQGLAVLFCGLCLGASLGASNLFQANQAYAVMATLIPGLPAWGFGFVLATLVGTVIIGGISRIGSVTERLVPLMAGSYMVACLVVLGVNAAAIPAAIATIVHEAFAPTAAVGGVMGVLVQGVRRSSFSNEAGEGSAAIAHAPSRTSEPIREGLVAALEPFIDTVVVCNMTAIAIVSTGVYQNTGSELSGVALTTQAFATVVDWFPIFLSLAACLFAFSTILSWSYYGLQAWSYLFGAETNFIFKSIYVLCSFIGCLISLELIIDFSDLMLLGMSLPNLIGCYILSNEVAADLRDYWRTLKPNP